MNVLVCGGAGYIGSYLVPKLLADGHKVCVVDTCWFGGTHPDNPQCKWDKKDLRDWNVFSEWQDAVIYLASVSNNAMCELNPVLENSCNRIAFAGFRKSAFLAGVDRFIYASSVAAYGSSDEDATEETPLRPTTLYGAGKAYCESVVKNYPNGIIVRSASVCGRSSNMRLDTTLNRMTHDAVRHGRIKVEGGMQKRSHVSLSDLCDFYRFLLTAPRENVIGQTFNVVDENQTVENSAMMVAEFTGAEVVQVPRVDNRSYSVSGTKARELGWEPKFGIRPAVLTMATMMKGGYWPDSLTNEKMWRMAYDII